MPNQLHVPFKRTTDVAIEDAVRDYIRLDHIETHPDKFKEDISHWAGLRREGTGGLVHVDRIPKTLK